MTLPSPVRRERARLDRLRADRDPVLAAGALQAAVLSALAVCLGPASGLAAGPIGAQHQAQLDLWFDRQARDAWSRASVEARTRRRLLMTAPGAWSAAQQDLLGLAIAPSVTARLRDTLARSFRRRSAPVPPESAPILLALSEQAWAAYGFNLRLAQAMQRTLRREVILHPPDPQRPRLAPQTCWLLMALFKGAVFDAAGAGVIAAAEARAVQAARQKEWAGFWDQYVLMRATGQGATLPTDLRGLPLISGGADALVAPTRHTAARPDWHAHAPAYARHLIGAEI